jgi:hypothetical protein
VDELARYGELEHKFTFGGGGGGFNLIYYHESREELSRPGTKLTSYLPTAAADAEAEPRQRNGVAVSDCWKSKSSDPTLDILKFESSSNARPASGPAAR